MAKQQFKGMGLTIKQPWAAAISFAGKNIENRSWSTKYRGPLAIHASGGSLVPGALNRKIRKVTGKPARPVSEWIERGVARFDEGVVEEPLIRGHIVAVAMLIDCVEISKSPWYVDDWGWVLKEVVPIEPIPWKGALRLWPCKFKYQPLKRID